MFYLPETSLSSHPKFYLEYAQTLHRKRILTEVACVPTLHCRIRMQQLGFDLDYTDANTQELVPWAKFTPDLERRIAEAPWKIVDTETTGLNPASKEISVSGRELRRGVVPRLRLRIVTVLYPLAGTVKGYDLVSFDIDKCSAVETHRICSAALKKVVICHNAGFDGYWLRLAARDTMPDLLLDSMLIARIMRPDHPVQMARLCTDESAPEDLMQAANNMFMSGRSGWSLADLSVGLLGEVMDKGYQGPKNWAEPFLSQEHYRYATDDTVKLLHIWMKLFQIDNVSEVLSAYYEAREKSRPLQVIEPQVRDIIVMREHGMPWIKEKALKYIKEQYIKVGEYADKMIELEPSLAPYRRDLADAGKGINAQLKAAIGSAFTARGLFLDVTEKTGTFKIGEKDLRRARAQLDGPAKELFDLWTGLNRAKKAGGMAKEVTGYAERAPDGWLHPNTGHGPVTGRLSSSEPNCQQFPRDENFRACVEALPGFKIVASDYSALDMRVGAALAIRAQRQIQDVIDGNRTCAEDAYKVIMRVAEKRINLPDAIEYEERALESFQDWKDRVDQVAQDKSASKRFWEEYRKRARNVLLTGFQRCLVDVRARAEADGTPDWGSLRNAFSILGMDIHTWTALSMIGEDPMQLFAGKPGEEVAAELKAWKKKLGDKRQTGKVGNLSLLYAMKAKGLQDAAAKNYNIHWTIEEAEKVRDDWLAAYVEIDLWHKWTELNAIGSVRVPDPERPGRLSNKQIFASYTLGGRLIYAFGLNAALSYEDQSSGADILGTVMDKFRNESPRIYHYCCNQVHDEVVFHVPAETVEEDTIYIQKVMEECAEAELMKFGVRGECSPAVGDVWLKD